jgi:RNA polymerase sigma-70 factor, ECF subfamily
VGRDAAEEDYDVSELDDFDSLTERYQRELLAHCYRMTGSVHEAEDLVQETLLRAWRASTGFEGRSSVRTWLYRIATNVCLTNIENQPRRPLPSGLGTPDQLAGDALEQDHEIAWLEPVPDALGTTVAAVNSALQRAHAQMDGRGLRAEDASGDDLDPRLQQLLDAYVEAFWRKDIAAIVALLKADAVWEMPPFTGWYRGAENIGDLIDNACPGQVHDMPMLPTRANGQPAFGMYMRGPQGVFTPFQLHVLDIESTAAGDRVRHVGAFFDPALFARCGLPAALPADFEPGDPPPGDDAVAELAAQVALHGAHPFAHAPS